MKFKEKFADWYAKKIVDYIFKLNDIDLMDLYFGIKEELRKRSNQLNVWCCWNFFDSIY